MFIMGENGVKNRQISLFSVKNPIIWHENIRQYNKFGILLRERGAGGGGGGGVNAASRSVMNEHYGMGFIINTSKYV